MMDFIGKVFSNSASGLITSVGEVADKFITTTEEKNKFKLELESLLQKRDSQIEQTFRSELQAKERILVAELQQGDSYTKRARPTLVYFGLMVIFFNYCLIPLLQFAQGATQFTPFALPSEFWLAWGGVVGTWSIGRSAERVGFNNKLTKSITGNRAPSLFDHAKG